MSSVDSLVHELKDNQLPWTVTWDPGTYVITELVATGYSLASLECTPGADVIVDLGPCQLTVNLHDGEDVRCTFVNERGSEINARVGDDRNGDGGYDAGEPWLQGSVVELYGEDNTLLDTTATDALGRVRFVVPAGAYSVCHTPTDGWTNTKPGVTPPASVPCYPFAVEPGRAAWMRFLDSQSPTATEPGAVASTVTFTDLPSIAPTSRSDRRSQPEP